MRQPRQIPLDRPDRKMIGTHHRPRHRARDRHHHPPHHKPVAPPLPGGAPASHESQLAYGSPVSAAGATPNPIPYLLQHARLLELEHQVEDTLKISVTPDAQTASKATSTTPDGALQITGTPGRRHSYWLLTAAVDIDEVMTANRKLASALGGDLSAGVSRVSMLRPAGTYNYKHQPRQPVRIVDLAGSRAYDLAQLVHGLADPSRPNRPMCPPPARSPGSGSRTPRSSRRTQR